MSEASVPVRLLERGAPTRQLCLKRDHGSCAANADNVRPTTLVVELASNRQRTPGGSTEGPNEIQDKLTFGSVRLCFLHHAP